MICLGSSQGNLDWDLRVWGFIYLFIWSFSLDVSGRISAGGDSLPGGLQRAVEATGVIVAPSYKPKDGIT